MNIYIYLVDFFFSSRRRQTMSALVTGVQTCALPILIEIEMHVAAGPDDFMRGEIAHLGDHARQQRRLEDVERKAEPKVARSLEEQTRQPAVAADVKLIGHVAGRQRHTVKVRYVTTGEDVAPRPRIVPKRIDQRRDLVVPLLGAAEKPVDRRFVARHSEESRVWQEWCSTFRSRWQPFHLTKHKYH